MRGSCQFSDPRSRESGDVCELAPSAPELQGSPRYAGLRDDHQGFVANMRKQAGER